MADTNEICELINDSVVACETDCVTTLNNTITKMEFLESETKNQSFLLRETDERFNTSIYNIQNSINIINTALKTLDQNDLRTVIENDRRLVDNNIQLMDTKIETVNTDLSSRINMKADKVALDTDINNLKTNSEIKINSSYTQLLNLITDIKNDLLLQETKLSYLVLNKSDLETKLNIISEITNLGTEENLDLINALSIENKKTADSVTELSNYFSKLKINLDIQFSGLEVLIKKNEENIITEITERRLDIKNLNNDISKIETKVDETLQKLRTDLDDFISIFNIKEQDIKTNYANIIKLINDNYIKVFNLVELESKNRIDSDNNLEIKINDFVNKFTKDLEAIDYSQNFEDLDNQIKNAIEYLNKTNEDLVNQFADLTSLVSKNTDEIQNIKNDLLARIDNAMETSNLNYETVFELVENKTNDLQEKLFNVNTELSNLETRLINAESLIGENDLEENALTVENIQEQLLTLQNSISKNIENINNLNNTIVDNKATILKDINDNNLILSNKVQDALTTAQNALDLNYTNITDLRNYLNRLNDNILQITGGANLTDINLESLSISITNSYNDLLSKITSVDNALKISCNSMDLRVSILEKQMLEKTEDIQIVDQNLKTIVKNLQTDFLTKIEEKNLQLSGIENKLDTNYSLIVDNDLKINTALTVLSEELKSKDNELQNLIESNFNILTSDINANTVLVNTIKDTFDSVQNELNTSINNEYEARSLAIKNLDDKLVQEIDERIKQGLRLEEEIKIQTDKLNSMLDGTDESLNSIKEVIDYISQLSGEKETMLTDLINDIKLFKNTILNNLNKETDFRMAEDEILKTSIENETKSRLENMESFSNMISQEIKDRMNAIQELDNIINEQKINLENLIKIQEGRLNTVITNMDTNLKNIEELISNTNLKIDTKITDFLNLINETKTEFSTKFEKFNDDVQDLFLNNNSQHDEFNKKLNDIFLKIDTFFGTRNDTLENIFQTISTTENKLTDKITESVIKAENDNNTLENKIKITTDELNQRIGLNNSNLINEISTRESQDKLLKNDILENSNKLIEINNELDTKINNEISARIEEDSNLTNTLNTEIQTRINQYSETVNNIELINTEISKNIKDFDKKILDNANIEQEHYENTLLKIDTEITDRKNQVNSLETIVTNEINRSVSKDLELENQVNANTSDISKIMADSDASLNSFKEVKDAMTTEKANTANRLSSIENDYKEKDVIITEKLNSEIANRISDTDGIKTTLNQEISDRITVNNSMSKTISDNKTYQDNWNSATTDKLNSEIFNRMEDIKNLTEKVNQEISDRSTEDQNIKNNLNSEINDRLIAEGNLSDRIQENYNLTTNFTENLDAEIQERKIVDDELKTELSEIQELIKNVFDGSSEDLDSFKEIVDLIRKSDFENDTNLLNFSKTVYNSIDELHTLLNSEANTRIGEDNLIRTELNNEIRERLSDYKILTQDFENNKVQIAQINSEFKDDIIKTITDNNKLTQNIINSINDDFENIRTLITSVNNDLLTEVNDRKFYVTELRNDLNSFINTSEDKYSSVLEILNNVSLEIQNKCDDNTALIKDEIAEQNETISKLNLGLDDTNNKISNLDTSLQALINEESIIRETIDTEIKDEIESFKTDVGNKNDEIDNTITNLDEKIQSILDGAEFDLEEFQKIVDVLNTIDPENDIIRNIKDDINFKISNVNSDMIKNKDEIIREINSIKSEALGLITISTENYTNRINDLKNSLLSSVQNVRDDNQIEIDSLSAKLTSELKSKNEFYNSLKSYIDIAIQNEKTFRINDFNTVNLKIIAETDNRQKEILDLRKELQNNIDIQSGGVLDKLVTLNNTLNKEIINRTFVTDSMLQTINNFINTNTDEIKTFTANINETINGFLELIGPGVEDFDNLSIAIQTSLNRLNELGSEIYDEIKTDIENGNIVGIVGSTGSTAGTSVDSFDVQSVLNTVDSRINDKVVQEFNRAQTKELELEAKIIRLRSDTQISLDENTQLVKEITNDILNLVNLKINDFENILETFDNKVNATNSYLEKEIALRNSQYSNIDSKLVSNKTDILNTISKLDGFINESNEKTETILNSTTEIINTKTNTLYKEFAYLDQDITSKYEMVSVKINDFQEMLASLNTSETDLKTQVQDIRKIIDDLLINSEVDLRSLENLVEYIKENDSDLLKIQNNIISGSGLNSLGEFVPYLNSHYLNNIDSLYNCLNKLDEVIFDNDNKTNLNIQKLTNDLNQEIQKRIDDVEIINDLIKTNKDLLQSQITSNFENISQNIEDIKKLSETLDNEIYNRTLNDDQVRLSLGLESDNSLNIENSNFIDDLSMKNSLITLDTQIVQRDDDLQKQIGDLTDLDTENKDDLVQAINETLAVAKTSPNFGTSSSFDDAFILQNL